MAIEIRVPTLGESITDATVGKWYKKAGDSARIDEPIVELETDKVTIEVPSPINGIITNIITPQGEDVKVGTIIGLMTEAKTENIGAPDSIASTSEQQPKTQSVEIMTQNKKVPHRIQTVPSPELSLVSSAGNAQSTAPSQLLKDVLSPEPMNETDREERVPMSRLRRTIARRLQEVQQTTAMLTTFNEVDMLNIMTLRKTYKEAFLNKHNVKLGLMSFFVKAIVQSLKTFPSLNAEIDDTDLIFKKYYHIGVAVGTEQGLVVPVLKDADQMGFEEIEKNIAALADKARNGLLTIEELQGGSFSLTNGGIYGSMMSTPILNAPQSAILGMHNIQDRPIALNGEVVIRPMMYLALTYDHRIVDGKDAVSFLTQIKKSLESPERLFLDL